MRKSCFLAFAVLLAAGPALSEIYRWVDEDGIVHYSDAPHPGADEVVLPDSPPPPSAPPQRPHSGIEQLAPSADESPADAVAYDKLAIASPTPEQTIWNNGGVLTVSLDLQPALQPGHRLRVYFDGKPQRVDGLQFELKDVYRGVHHLQAEVLDQTGQLIIRSEPVRFYVHQTSVVN